MSNRDDLYDMLLDEIDAMDNVEAIDYDAMAEKEAMLCMYEIGMETF